MFSIFSAVANTVITVNGAAVPGARLWSQPFNHGAAQQFILAQYPGTDLSNADGVVFVFYHAASGLVLQAGGCNQPVTLQNFQQFNLSQLWSYPLARTYAFAGFVNVATGCFLDLQDSNWNGGTIQTYQGNNTTAQQWSANTVAAAAAVGAADPAIQPAEG